MVATVSFNVATAWSLGRCKRHDIVCGVATLSLSDHQANGLGAAAVLANFAASRHHVVGLLMAPI